MTANGAKGTHLFFVDSSRCTGAGMGVSDLCHCSCVIGLRVGALRLIIRGVLLGSTVQKH